MLKVYGCSKWRRWRLIPLQDMNLALTAAQSVNVPLPLGESSVSVYEDTTKDEDLAKRDFSVVFRHLEKLKATKTSQ